MNSGVRGGVLKSFIFHIKHNNKEVGKDTVEILDLENRENIRGSIKTLIPRYLKGKESCLVNIGKYFNNLDYGKYDCELIILLHNKKEIKKSFYFLLKEETPLKKNYLSLINIPDIIFCPISEENIN